MGGDSDLLRRYKVEGLQCWLWGSPPVSVLGVEGEYVVEGHRGLYQLKEGELHPIWSFPHYTKEEGWQVQKMRHGWVDYVPMSESPMAPLVPALTLMAERVVQEQEREWRETSARHPSQTTFVDYALAHDVPLDQVLLILLGTHPGQKTGVYGKHFNAKWYAGGHRVGTPENAGYDLFENHANSCTRVVRALGREYVLPENLALHNIQAGKRDFEVSVQSSERKAFEACLPKRPVAAHTLCPVSGIRYSVGKACPYCPIDPRLLLEGACAICEERFPQAEWKAHLGEHLPHARLLEEGSVAECFLPVPA